jgi:hypothetical protein
MKQPMQRTGIKTSRMFQGCVCIQVDECVDLRLSFIDPIKATAHQIDCTDFPARKQPSCVSRSQAMKWWLFHPSVPHQSLIRST